jgi:hypothetical protein
MFQCNDCGMDKSLRYADQYFEPIKDSHLIKQIDVSECDWCGEVRSEETTFNPEQARMIVPQTMMTEWYWSGSLQAFARVCNQRLDHHSQEETQEIARLIQEQAITMFPVSWIALSNH